MDTEVWAESDDDAIEKALLDSRRPRAKLGWFIDVQADGEEEVSFVGSPQELVKHPKSIDV